MSTRVEYGITNPVVEDYLYSMLHERPAVLQRMEQEAKREHVPIVGPLVGKFLMVLAAANRSKRILEVGTAIGYSTSWFASAARLNRGRVVTIEFDEDRFQRARANLKEVGLARFVEMLKGDAFEVIPRLRGKFDFAFIDANKEDYPQLLNLILPKLQRRAILVADNALWGGSVAINDNTAGTAAMRKFNRDLCALPDFETVILPVRDGLAVAFRHD